MAVTNIDDINKLLEGCRESKTELIREETQYSTPLRGPGVLRGRTRDLVHYDDWGVDDKALQQPVRPPRKGPKPAAKAASWRTNRDGAIRVRVVPSTDDDYEFMAVVDPKGDHLLHGRSEAERKLEHELWLKAINEPGRKTRELVHPWSVRKVWRWTKILEPLRVLFRLDMGRGLFDHKRGTGQIVLFWKGEPPQHLRKWKEAA